MIEDILELEGVFEGDLVRVLVGVLERVLEEEGLGLVEGVTVTVLDAVFEAVREGVTEEVLEGVAVEVVEGVVLGLGVRVTVAVLDAVVETVREAVRVVEIAGEEVADSEGVSVADLLGGGLGPERTGLGPQSYIPEGQITVPFTLFFSMHTSLFSSGCWQGPEVK